MDLAAKTGEGTREATPSPRDCLLSKPNSNIKGMAGEKLVVRWGQTEPAGRLDPRGNGCQTPEAHYTTQYKINCR